MALVGEPLSLSMRILKCENSMLRLLWPDFYRYVEPESWELSRWLAHRKNDLKTSRILTLELIKELKKKNIMKVFSVTTDRLSKAHKFLGMAPEEEHIISENINLCRWKL